MKLRKKEKKYLSYVGLLAYFSGAALFIFEQWVRVPSPIGLQHHTLEHWVRVLHTMITYLIVLAVGYLVKGHILPGLRSRTKKRLWSGLGTFSLFFILMLTALFILYGGEGPLTRSMSLTHSIVGLACPLLIFAHALRGNKTSIKLKKSTYIRKG